MRFECMNCSECPSIEEWNEHSHYDDDMDLPGGLDGGLFDCPACGEVVCGEDLNEV